MYPLTDKIRIELIRASRKVFKKYKEAEFLAQDSAGNWMTIAHIEPVRLDTTWTGKTRIVTDKMPYSINDWHWSLIPRVIPEIINLKDENLKEFIDDTENYRYDLEVKLLNAKTRWDQISRLVKDCARTEAIALVEGSKIDRTAYASMSFIRSQINIAGWQLAYAKVILEEREWESLILEGSNEQNSSGNG